MIKLAKQPVFVEEHQRIAPAPFSLSAIHPVPALLPSILTFLTPTKTNSILHDICTT
jgi:hypothetical protein